MPDLCNLAISREEALVVVAVLNHINFHKSKIDEPVEEIANYLSDYFNLTDDELDILYQRITIAPHQILCENGVLYSPEILINE